MALEKNLEALDGIGDAGSDIRHLFSYNLQRLASISSKIATQHTLNQFELTVQEWRALAVLHFLEEAPLVLLAQRAGIQKSQASRLTADLEKRGYIFRHAHPVDKRSTLLSLTDTGRELVARILDQSRDRNRQMLQHLSDEERVELMRLMGKVFSGSKTLLDELKRTKDSWFETKDQPASFFETE